MTTLSDPRLLNGLSGVLCLLIAGAAMVAERRISPLKTYYPLLRRIFALLVAVYLMGAAAAFTGYTANATTSGVRLIGELVMAALVLWANLFISRRNRRPQWFVVHNDGTIEPRPAAEMHTMVLNVGSAARHGDLSLLDLDQLTADIAEGRRIHAWRVRLAHEQAMRRAGREDAP